jgi:ABC-type transport system involved in multi-copper enzyme maturation permease subunit
VTASSYTEAMLLAYTLEFAIAYVGLSPGIVVADIAGGGLLSEWSPWILPVIAVPMLGAAAFFYFIALRRFRALRNMTWMKRSEPPPRPLPRPKPKRPRPKRRPSTARPIPDAALFWKETEYNRYAIDLPSNLIWLGLGAFLCMSGWYAILQLWEDRALLELGKMLTAFAVIGYIVLLVLTYLSIIFQATSAVAHERERNTLDFLLLLPVERSRILFVKWVAPWIRQRMMLLAMLALPLMGMVTTMFPARATLLMLLLPWPSLLMINTLGLYLSVVCRRTVTANILLIAILVVGFVLHLLAWDGLIFLTHGYIDVLVDDRFPDAHTRLRARLMVLGHQTLILLLALLFARLAFWRFERMSTAVSSQGG